MVVSDYLTFPNRPLTEFSIFSISLNGEMNSVPALRVHIGSLVPHTSAGVSNVRFTTKVNPVFPIGPGTSA
jgi:hypothetical protein